MDIFERYGPAQLAKWAGCKPPSVIEWRGRGIPADRCPNIERGSGGEFPCEQLNPSARWVRIPDRAWPWHPAGRPLLDVSNWAQPPQHSNQQAA